MGYTTEAINDLQYLGHLHCYAFGFLRIALFTPAPDRASTKHEIAGYAHMARGHARKHVFAGNADKLGTLFRIWYTAKPFTEQYALRTYSLRQRIRGCKVLSSRETDVLLIQQNLTGI